MADDEEDSVIHEIDVYLTKKSDDDLFVFQYPSRSNKRPFDNVNIVEAKIKPIQKKVELAVALDTRKSTYDTDRGSQFAITSKDSNFKTYFESDFMDRQIFQTTQTKHSLQKYFIGYLKHGQLHLSVISAILQLHSSFSYMDTDGDKASENESYMNGEEQEAKPVTVKFARPESDRAKKAREKSFSYFINKLGQEPWLPLRHYSIETEFSEKLLSQLIGRSDELIANFGTVCDEYIKTILATNINFNEQNSLVDSKTVDATQNKTIINQMQSLLINVKISHFHDLLNYLGKNIDPMTALRALQHVAVLIHGCWVVKSEFLYPKYSASAMTGVSADMLCRARDLILWHFTQYTYVTRNSISSLFKIPDEDLKQMLSQIACYEIGKGWKLLLPPDDTFDRRYPEVMQRQKLLWDAKYLNLSKYFKQSDSEFQAGLQSPLKYKITANRSSEIESENQSSKNIDNVNIKMEVDTPENNILATSTFDCELASFVGDRLAAYKVITVSELRRHLNQKLSQSAPGHILSSGVTDSLLEATLKEIGAMCLSAMWPAVMTDEAIYAYIKVNDSTEKLRRSFLELFQENCKLRKPAIKKGMEKAMGTTLSDDDFSLLQRDYCTAPKKGCYFIKFSRS